MKATYMFIVILAIIIGFFGWQKIDNIISQYTYKKATSFEHRLICESIISESDFRDACRSSDELEEVRVIARSVFFPNLNLCSITITGSGQASLHIVIDAFPGEEQAVDRFEHRKRNALVKEENVLKKVNENTVLDGGSSSRSLLLQKDHVYAEVTPSGGGLCPKEELYSLGRVVEERMLLFLPQRR
jgi:hypothetical protein